MHLTLVVETTDSGNEPDNMAAKGTIVVPALTTPGGLFGTILEALERAGITSLAFVQGLQVKPEE